MYGILGSLNFPERLISYKGYWEAPGRWSLEFITNENRYFLRPMEKLSCQKKGSLDIVEDGFIKATAFTAGNMHDSNHFVDLLSGKESAVYADGAYKSQKHDDWLIDHHVDNKVIERSYRSTSLTPEQKKNRRNSGTRCTVERVFGVLKLHYGMGQARYLGLARNRIASV
ncbi:transposase [Porticoccaceae bacterium]|nr:transposase [Porticoccaceae bacterium]